MWASGLSENKKTKIVEKKNRGKTKDMEKAREIKEGWTCGKGIGKRTKGKRRNKEELGELEEGCKRSLKVETGEGE